MGMMAFVLAVMLGFALAFAGTVRAGLGLVVGAIAMWIAASYAEHWFFNQPEIYAHLVFAYFVLPVVIAPSTGIVVGLTLGPPRHLVSCALAACAGCVAGLLVTSNYAQDNPQLRDCFRDMAAPSVLAAAAAVFVTRLARRRVA
jgi:hypothetical protein